MAKRLLSIDDATGKVTADNAVAIPVGRGDFDFNAALATGEYSGAATNNPEGTGGGNFWRCSVRSAEGFTSQVATRGSTGKQYSRATANNGATWSPWREVVYTDNPTFTGNAVLPETTNIGTVTSTEIKALSGVTFCCSKSNQWSQCSIERQSPIGITDIHW